MPLLRAALVKVPDYSKWVIKCFTQRHTISEFFANCWSTQACRIISGFIKLAIRCVYPSEKKHIAKFVKKCVEVEQDAPDSAPQLIVQMINEPTANTPLTLKMLYQFLMITTGKDRRDSLSLLSQFYFYSIFDEFATLSADFRYIMLSFKVHSMLLMASFSNHTSLDQLLPNVVFLDNEMDHDAVYEDSLHKDSKYENSDDDLGKFRQFKLSKFEHVVISNLGKDVEPFLFIFKVISKLVRSCSIQSESKTNYEDSQYKMDNASPLAVIHLRDFTNIVDPSENTMNVLFGIRCINKPLRNELAKLYGHLLFNNEKSILL